MADLLASAPDLTLAHTFRSIQQAHAFLSRTSSGRGLWLLDLGLPDGDGLSLVPEIRARFPECPIVALTTFNEDKTLRNALHTGVNGFLLKDLAPKLLLTEIRAVSLGGTAINKNLAEKIFAQWASTSIEREPNLSDAALLSQRELEILELLAQGFSNPEIAEELEIARGTVRKHTEHIFTKLGVNSRVQAIQRGIQLGLIEPYL